MRNRWVISWLVIDYWRWWMSNRWVIEAPKFCGLSITHRWHIDYSSTIILRTKDTCLLVPFVFVCDPFIWTVLDAFFLVSELPVDESNNQCENETNKYADNNRLLGYRFLWVFVCKVKLLWLRETSVIGRYITSLSIECLYNNSNNNNTLFTLVQLKCI